MQIKRRERKTEKIDDKGRWTKKDGKKLTDRRN